MADATGIVWVEPTEITSLTDETWTTVSAPSVIPSNAKGIFGYWETQSANVGTPRQVGVRHTSDTSRSTLHDTSGGGYAHLFIVGLDGSNQFQYWQENDVEGDQKLFVHGYFTGDVYFKTAAVDLEPNLPESSSWQTDIDLTSDTSASATAVFLQVYNSTIVRAWGAQHSGDTANRSEDTGRDGHFVIVPMGSGQLLDLQIELNSEQTGEIWLLGYMEGGIVDTAYTDVTPTANSTWETITSPSASAANGAALIRQFDDSGTSSADGDTWSWRELNAAEQSFSIGLPSELGNGGMALVRLDPSADYQTWAVDPATEDTFIYQACTLSLGETPYPYVSSWVTGYDDTAQADHDIALTGLTIDANDLIIAWVSVDGLTISLTWDQSSAGTWTAVYANVDGNTINGNCYAKIADGTEDSATLTVTTSATEAISWAILVIKNAWQDVSTGVTATTSNQATSSPNPPEHTAAWGTDTNLWVAGYHHDDAVDGAVTSWPSELWRNRYESQSTSNGNTTAAISTREYEIDTYDPPSYNSTGSDQVIAFTLVVRPFGPSGGYEGTGRGVLRGVGRGVG
jgi:hypothetical protein